MSAEVLHDTFEDSETNKKAQKEEFCEQTVINTLDKGSSIKIGQQVAHAVDAVTKRRVLDVQLNGKAKEDNEHTNYKSLLYANIWEREMKGHDRIDNLLSLLKESLEGVLPEVSRQRRRQREEQIEETREFILPLATSYTRDLLLQTIESVEASTRKSVLV